MGGMKKSILLIRHAQSANNALPEPERVPDPALTPLGQQQAELLAEGLARYQVPISELVCSPFRRSLDTTLPVSRRLRLRPSIRADIYEQGGCYSGHEVGAKRGEPGMCCNVLGQCYPDWIIDPLIGPQGWNFGRQYESFHEVVERARGVNQWLSDDWQPLQEGTAAALIIHADFKRVLLTEMLGGGAWSGSDSPIWNTAITHVRFSAGRWQLMEWNAVDHLPDDMRTPFPWVLELKGSA